MSGHISPHVLLSFFTAQAVRSASNSGSQLLERPPTLWLGQDENLRFWWFWFWNRICANWRTVPSRLAFQVRLFTSKKDLCDKDVDGESASSNEWLQDMGSPTTKNFAEHVWKIWGTERSLCYLFSTSKSLLLQSLFTSCQPGFIKLVLSSARCAGHNDGPSKDPKTSKHLQHLQPITSRSFLSPPSNEPFQLIHSLNMIWKWTGYR